MRTYLIPVMGLCFVVDGLLLVGTAGLNQERCSVGNTVLSAALGALYGGACLLPQTAFLGKGLWRLAVLVLMGTVAFGFGKESIRSTALFALLNMAAGGLAMMLHGESSVFAVAAILFLLMMLLRKRPGRCVPVVIGWGEEKLELLALRDTGNTLLDPVSGERVLVVGSQIAQKLLGLTKHQLFDPVNTLQTCPVPGLRLIPYRAVSGQGFLLAMRLPDVQIGNRKRSAVVAFAPAGLDGEERFQALTGGFA